MKDPARIDRIISMLREVWHDYSDMRLGQLLTNIALNLNCGKDFDLFNLDDDDLEETLKSFFKSPGEKN